MFRLALFIILSVFFARAFWRMVDGVVEGMSGRPKGSSGNVQHLGVQMARDPVCGTYVVPDRAVALADGPRQFFFCSTACRDKYLARPKGPKGPEGPKGTTGSGRPDPVEGRTA